MRKKFLHLAKAINEIDEANAETLELQLVKLLSEAELERIDFALQWSMRIDLRELILHRENGKPLDYILGGTYFMGREFLCNAAALIPRQETELLVEITKKNARKMQHFQSTPLVIMDVGTGSGNIAVSLALELDNIRIFATDISRYALEIARMNVRRFDLEHKISLFSGDLFEPFNNSDFERKGDIIVSNPPYIPSNSVEKLPHDIIEFEPRIALDGGVYGIDIFKKLINESAMYLKPGGVLIFEIGVGQEKLITRLFERNAGFSDIKYYSNGINQIRVMSGRKIN